MLCLLFLVGSALSQQLTGNQNQLLVVVQDGKYGFIDHKGNIVIRPQFSWAEDFWDDYGEVYVCGRYVSIDSTGALFPLRFAEKDQLEPKHKNNKVGFIDSSGTFKISPIFDDALPFSEGLAAVKIDYKWGFIDTSGRQVIPPRFSLAFYFEDGVGVVESDSSYLLIDTSGKVLASGFDLADPIADGRVPVRVREKAGYLDLRGKVVIPLIYDSVNGFSSGLAAVEKNDKWGYIDKDGKVVIPFEFDSAGYFASGLAPAKSGSTRGFINKTGQFSFYLPFEYSPGFLAGNVETDISRFWTDDNKFGYVNTSGQVVWGPLDESPDHPPLIGWSEKDKANSCEGIPAALKVKIADFPSD
ncbi:MAG TPA: WG repeat-containing protein [Candidatus Acidoferrales bacterium]|nr:WG repeat-containing protein [Candidatus Acidoferrales bacterium]